MIGAPRHPLPTVLLFLLIGAFIGSTLLFSVELPNKQFVAVVSALSFPFLALLIKDLRRFLLAAAVLSIPLHIDINFMHKFEQQAGASTAGVSLADLLALGLLLIWLIEIAGHERPYSLFFARVTVPAIIYFEIAVLSMLWAPRLDLAFMEVFRMFKFTLIFFILINHIRDEDDLRLVVWAFIAAVAFEGVISTLQMMRGGRLGLDFLGEAPPDPDGKTTIWRVMGTLGHPNRLATFLETLLMLPVGMFMIEKRRFARLLCVGSFALGIIALIMTGTRGAWIGFSVAVLSFIVNSLRNPHLNVKSIVKPMIIVFAVLTVAAVFLSDMLEQRLMGEDYGSAAGRIPMIKIALNIIAAHPFGGVGINNFQVNMREYNDAIESVRYTTIARPVHNMFLLAAGETGLVGLAAMLLLLIALVRTLLQTVTSPLPLPAVTSVALLGGLAAFCLHGMVDKHPPGGSLLFYAVAATAVASYLIHRRHQSAARPTHV